MKRTTGFSRSTIRHQADWGIQQNDGQTAKVGRNDHSLTGESKENRLDTSFKQEVLKVVSGVKWGIEEDKNRKWEQGHGNSERHASYV